MSLMQDVRVEALLNIRCIVKGYHLCRFEVKVGEVFTANKKRGERRNGFKVVNHRGKFSHPHSELVDPLWSLHADISVLMNYFIIIIIIIVNIKMKCVYNYCLQQNFVFCVSIPVPLICNQSIPINLSTGMDNRYRSITTQIFHRLIIDYQYQSIN